MSFTFNRNIFFRDFSNRSRLTLSTNQLAGLEFLLEKIETDTEYSMIREISYVLATIRWETAETFQPIKEKRFNRSTHPKAWENQDVYWRTGFFGRGYVQITWEKNYCEAGTWLAGRKFQIFGNEILIEQETLVQNPEFVLDPEVSYAICANGMRNGWFTGKKLSDFICENIPPDYFNARRIVNGLDHADNIEIFANQFELILRASVENQP